MDCNIGSQNQSILSHLCTIGSESQRYNPRGISSVGCKYGKINWRERRPVASYFPLSTAGDARLRQFHL